MIERWALISGLKGDLDTYELIQKDLKNFQKKQEIKMLNL